MYVLYDVQLVRTVLSMLHDNVEQSSANKLKRAEPNDKVSTRHKMTRTFESVKSKERVLVEKEKGLIDDLKLTHKLVDEGNERLSKE